MVNNKTYIFKATASFFLVLFSMPIGHASMIVMESTMSTKVLHLCAFSFGLVGILLTIIGVFVKGDTKQTLLGLFGGLLFWTGWVEFLFQYYAQRFGTMALMTNGTLMSIKEAISSNMEIATKPEYLILPATFGFWAMFMLLYLFCIQSGCDFLNRCQKIMFGKHKNDIIAFHGIRHTSIVTFMEFNMIIWTSYLLLMFLYDDSFVGEHSLLTLAVSILCLVSSVLIFKKQLHLSSWGSNIRMAIATVIILWIPIEIFGRLNFFKEFWIYPRKYCNEMIAIVMAFIIVICIILINVRKKQEVEND